MFEGSPSPSSLGYTVLRQWKPHDDPDGYGAELLLNQDATAQELIDDIKKLSEGHDPVSITIWSSRVAYDLANDDIYGDEYDRGLILVHHKNLTRPGVFYGFNQIRWLQEKGKFSSRSGTVTKL